MSKLLNVFFRALLALSLLIGTQVAQAEIAVITHPGVKEIGLSQAKIADMFLGKIKKYSNGEHVKPVDQRKNNPIRDKFYLEVLKMSAGEVNRYWAKRKYTGKGKPPREIVGDEAVKTWVASHPGAIGYIDGKYLDTSVKVVLIIP